MRALGATLLVIGIGSFILPMIGLQFQLINVFGEDSQPVVGLIAAGLGAILFAVGSIRERKAPAKGTPLPPAAHPPEGSGLHCPACGAPASPGDRFCGECGAPLVTIPQRETPPPTPPKKSRRGLMALGIAAVIVIALLFAYRLVPEFRSEQPRPVTPTLTSQVAETTVATIEWGEIVVTAPSEEPPDVGPEESTYIHATWLEHNLLFEGTYYLAVHSSFQVSRSDSSLVWVMARFWFSDGSPMSAQSSDYALQEQAGVWELADVIYEPVTRWDDFRLLIPYSALAVGEGHYATVEIRDVATDEMLGWMETESFSVNP